MRLIAIFLLAALAAFAEGAAGKWKATFQGQNGPMEVLFNFQVNEGKLTGSVTTPQGDLPVVDGKVDGPNLTFTLQHDEVKITNSATIAGDEMKIKGHMNDRDFELTAKRLAD